jgi:hypothetical protein
MSTRKHSPGPWKVVKKINNYIMDKESNMVSIISVSLPKDYIEGNIALLSNAPNMLDVITQYLDSMRHTKAQGSIAWTHALTVYEAASQTKYDHTMSKQEAIRNMTKGLKLAHTYFLGYEWITMYEEGIIITDQGYIINANDFWHHRQVESFDYGWEIWKE